MSLASARTAALSRRPAVATAAGASAAPTAAPRRPRASAAPQPTLHTASGPRAAPRRAVAAPRGLTAGFRGLVAARAQAGGSGAPEGQVNQAVLDGMSANIRTALDATAVSVKDVYGDGRHVTIHVVADAFDGKSTMNRQRMVYKAIWEELQSVVHAVDEMITQTPAEAGI